VLSYRVMPGVLFQLEVLVPGLLTQRRREIGTWDGTRAPTARTKLIGVR
jgi:hypothetical protein